MLTGPKLNPRQKACSQLSLDIRRPGRAHLIGIGGSGMRALAEVLLGYGWELSGSDLAVNSVGQLSQAGVRFHHGHCGSHVPRRCNLVIHSDAIGADNPELLRAVELGVPLASYFETLGRLMSPTRGLAVAGTHGKSTTTAMAAAILVVAGMDPTVVYGAAPLGRFSGGRPGRGGLTLVEACEYRANFLHLCPTQAVILGIEPDHFDCYHSLEELELAFAQFSQSIPQNGLILARRGCASTERATSRAECRVETFGFDRGANWWAGHLSCRRGRYCFKIARGDRRLADVQLQVPGKHNVLNALAAAALAWENGVGTEKIAQGLERFRGLGRRLEILGDWRGITLIDDYAHHPTEVLAGLRSVRRMYPGRRLWCVFQPHQASRTKHLLDELASSLNNADKVVVSEIFRARESAPTQGEVTAADLAEKIRKLGAGAANVHAPSRIVSHLESELSPGDVLITMGAGDIREICNELIDRFRKNRAAG